MVGRTTKRILPAWVKEVGKKKSYACGAERGMCRANKYF
jgi:hypothetical protein